MGNGQRDGCEERRGIRTRGAGILAALVLSAVLSPGTAVAEDPAFQVPGGASREAVSPEMAAALVRMGAVVVPCDSGPVFSRNVESAEKLEGVLRYACAVADRPVAEVRRLLGDWLRDERGGDGGIIFPWTAAADLSGEMYTFWMAAGSPAVAEFVRIGPLAGNAEPLTLVFLFEFDPDRLAAAGGEEGPGDPGEGFPAPPGVTAKAGTDPEISAVFALLEVVESSCPGWTLEVGKEFGAGRFRCGAARAGRGRR